MTDEETRRQVAEQCRAVAHMARAIAEVHEELIPLYLSEFGAPDLMEIIGKRTAGLLEVLGDIMNNMEVVTECDAWIDPIIAEAQRRWPQPSVNGTGGREGESHG